jgi:hypothetical protein
MTGLRLAGLSLNALTGIAGALGDECAMPPPWLAVNLHAAFGCLLVAMVVIDFRAQSHGGGMALCEASALCRKLSRTVYLLLYSVIAAEQILRAALRVPVTQPPENLRDYFSYGLLALLAVRALAAISVRRQPAPRTNPRLEPVEGAAAPR